MTFLLAPGYQLSLQLLLRMDNKERLKSRRKLAGWYDNYTLNLPTLF